MESTPIKNDLGGISKNAHEATKEAKSFANEKIVQPMQAAAHRVGDAVKHTSDSAIGMVADNMEAIGKRISDRGAASTSFPETTQAVGQRIQDSAQALRAKGVDGLVEDTRTTVSKHPLASIACVAAAFIFIPRLFSALRGR